MPWGQRESVNTFQSAKLLCKEKEIDSRAERNSLTLSSRNSTAGDTSAGQWIYPSFSVFGLRHRQNEATKSGLLKLAKCAAAFFLPGIKSPKLRPSRSHVTTWIRWWNNLKQRNGFLDDRTLEFTWRMEFSVKKWKKKGEPCGAKPSQESLERPRSSWTQNSLTASHKKKKPPLLKNSIELAIWQGHLI